jgi:subtilisin family serine protease
LKKALLFSGLIFAATILLATPTLQAGVKERYIVQHNGNSRGLKLGHAVKAQGRGWFAVELDEKGKSALRGKAGFVSLEIDPKRFPLSIYNDGAGSPDAEQVVPYGYYQSEADQLTLQPGQKVCVIDSGIAGSNGETGGYNQDFNWPDITGDNDPGTGRWDADGGPHGTHVAGTIGAVDNNIGVIGMAPGVPMHIIKVFNNAGWGYSSDLAQAAELCARAGANIISMSLGGGGANNTEENAFNTFTANGGLVIAAAGNDGNSVRSYPAGYASVMMVGAVDANNLVAGFSQYPSNAITTGRGKKRVTTTNDGYGVEVTAGGVGTLSTVPSGVGAGVSLIVDGASYSASAMENTGSASGATYNFGLGNQVDSGAYGKICIIERGLISFEDKVINCETSGGVGAIIYNNEPGLLTGTLGTTGSTSIPTVGAAQERSASLLAAAQASILIGASDYDYFSGTSMATPTTSGVAALVWSNHPGCSNEDIRDALKATAEDQGAPGRDDYYGYGIIKAKAASDLLSAQGCGGTPPPPPPPGNNNPSAAFSYTCTLLVCTFDASASSDSDGDISSYRWDFGDTTESMLAVSNHTYGVADTYTVRLTVTDGEGATDTSSKTVTVTDSTEPPANITLDGERTNRGRTVTLSWNGASGSSVDVYINGSLNGPIANTGGASYSVNKRRSYTFEICETNSRDRCSSPLVL